MSPTDGTSMTCDPELRLRLDRFQTVALVVGGAGLALCLAAWLLWPAHFFAPYLVGYLFWLGIALGCIGPDDAASPGRRLVGAGDPPAARGGAATRARRSPCCSCRSPWAVDALSLGAARGRASIRARPSTSRLPERSRSS